MRFFFFLSVYLRGLQRRDPVVITTSLIVVSLIAYVIIKETKKDRHMRKTKPIIATMSMDGTKEFYLFVDGMKETKGISSQGFDSAEEVFHYVYKKYDEAVFEKLVIHRKGKENAVFTHDDAQTETENIARLNDCLFGEPKTTENP
jgi:hypothetical protein